MREQSNHKDETLLSGFRQGSEKSFSGVFRALYPAMCFYALRITSDQTAAEDIAAESFIKIWDRREMFHDMNVLKSWLYTTTRNACLNWLKQSKRQRLSERELAYLNPENEKFILQDLIHAEFLREVYAAMDSLPPQCRKVMTMMFVEGKNTRQIAEELGLSLGTIKTQKARGLSLLKTRLPEFSILLSVLLLD